MPVTRRNERDRWKGDRSNRAASWVSDGGAATSALTSSWTSCAISRQRRRARFAKGGAGAVAYGIRGLRAGVEQCRQRVLRAESRDSRTQEHQQTPSAGHVPARWRGRGRAGRVRGIAEPAASVATSTSARAASGDSVRIVQSSPPRTGWA